MAAFVRDFIFVDAICLGERRIGAAGASILGRFVYQVVKHKSGWAYRLEHTYSRVFPTQSDAVAAAKDAAREMHEPGDETVVRVEDGPLRWRTELTLSPRREW